MKRFRCPACGEEVEALATEVKHRCGGKWRMLIEVKDDE